MGEMDNKDISTTTIPTVSWTKSSLISDGSILYRDSVTVGLHTLLFKPFFSSSGVHSSVGCSVLDCSLLF